MTIDILAQLVQTQSRTGQENNMDAQRLLAQRESYAKTRLGRLRERLNASPIAKVLRRRGVCVYATGSFARGEASPYSDLDVFLLDTRGECAQIELILLKAQLIQSCRSLKFAEFSGDGEYLVLHSMKEMLTRLGSPHDDYMNLFTARMLLLLESVPLMGDKAYGQAVTAIVNSYYRDYHDHETNFRPTFLANDIIRFWKTMCLNYEHKRNRQRDESGSDASSGRKGEWKTKAKSHLKNLKLKFSRMTTCYSTVAALAALRQPTDPQELVHVVQQPPLKRLQLTAGGGSAQGMYEELISLYAWFLERTAAPSDDVLGWIGNRRNRDEAFGKARAYGRLMFELLVSTAGAGSDTHRLLLI